MYVELDDFKTGWYGLNISLRSDEIDVIIEHLINLKKDNSQHFHISSDYEGDGGVGDIEINVKENGQDNMSIVGFAIPPNR